MNVTALHSHTTVGAGPAEKHDRARSAAQQRDRHAHAARSPFRKLVYRVWPFLPAFVHRLAFSLTAERVTLGACAVVIDLRGRVLVAHHTYRRRAWGLPGGLVGKGEQPHAALERELREELGVEVGIGPLVHSELEQGHLTLYFRTVLLGTPAADGIEIDQLRYVTPAELVALTGEPAPEWLTACWKRRTS